MLKEKPESESPADCITFYLERDILGKLANMHLRLCDQYGQFGPKHEDCLFLSHLQSVAVDLAKHGECVAQEAYQKYDNLLEDWPDFFEKPYKKMRISQGILGKLFRDIDINQIYEASLRDDYKHSICLDYELDNAILSLCKDKKVMHSYL